MQQGSQAFVAELARSPADVQLLQRKSCAPPCGACCAQAIGKRADTVVQLK